MFKNNEILEIENFLPENFFEEISSLVFDEKNFPWFFLENVSAVENNDFKQYGFSHILYDKKDNFYSQYFSIFYPIKFFIESKFQINILDIIRYRLGLNLNITDNKRIIHTPHTDFEFNHYVFLLYLNDSDGPTIFYSGEDILEINPSANKAILFNGSIPHSSSTPIQNSKRVALNINLILEGKNEKKY